MHTGQSPKQAVSKLMLLFLMLFSCTLTNAQVASEKGKLVIPPFVKVPERKPLVPLKTKRMIFSDKDIAIAKQNVEKFPEATKLKDAIVKNADSWLSWSDQDLRNFLADARVPRAFDLNPGGCPVHGDKVFTKGFYPWIIDPKTPFKVKCPIGDEMYPSNDFATYYRSDFKAPINKNETYADDGWGWLAPNGERFWFVAYANHWLWMNEIRPGMSNLARAYLLTGDVRYAHKAAVMLHRMAEVYPSMDHENQSRYGLMSKADNIVYNGKIVNHIWEAGLIQDAAEVYDAIWDSIDSDEELRKFYGKSSEEIRSFIEANLLEEGIDSYFNGKVQGNYGMHQMALLYLLLARDHVDTEKHLHVLVDEPGKDVAHSGIRYALYNQVFRDGLAYESPDYNLTWVNELTNLAETLKKGGTDLFLDKRFKMLLDGPLAIVATGLYSPDWGDSGHTLGRIGGRNADAYQVGYAAYKDRQYLTWLASNNQTGGNTFSTFPSLFREVLPATQPLTEGRSVPPMPSRLFAGYGNGILSNPMDKTALSLTYGMHVSHYHWDFLNFELFANGQKMMPDLGYPDAMNAYVSEVYTWSTNTAPHNTVVVDAQKQQRNMPGVVHDFSQGSFARSMDASSPAYRDASQYRRNMIMVDVPGDQSYVVDFFHVTGGKQHDYLLHGPPGTVEGIQGNWGTIQPGTLAGPTVQPGVLYDDEKLGKKGYDGGYGSYRGSGYQHLYNVQQLKDAHPILQYQHVSDKDALLRIHLQDQNQQEVFMADAYDKPRAKSHVLKYLIARKKAEEGAELKSSFVSVLEPFKSKSFILSTQKLALDSGEGQVVEVVRDGATEVVINDTLNSVKKLKQYQIETDANSVVLTFDSNKKLVRLFFSNGTYLRHKGKLIKLESTTGRVTSVSIPNSEVKVQLEKSSRNGKSIISGETAYFTNSFRTAVHPLTTKTLTGNTLTLKTKDDLLVGKLRIETADNLSAKTSTNLPFELLYNGVTVLDQNYNPLALVEKISKRQLTLSTNNGLKSGSDVWLSNLGVGDKVMIKNCISWEAGKK